MSELDDFFDPIPELPPEPAASPAPKRGRRKRAEPEPATSTALDTVPTTFEQALGLCSDEERSFVRAYIADPTKGAARAYAAAFPASRSAKSRGPALLDKERVAIAIKLGREAVAKAVAEACKFDRQAAFEELGTLMEKATAAGQYTAATRASELRARLTGTLVDRQEIKTSNFSLVFEGMPGATPAPVIDVTPSIDKLEEPGK